MPLRSEITEIGVIEFRDLLKPPSSAAGTPPRAKLFKVVFDHYLRRVEATYGRQQDEARGN
jgi:hypothetical protein